MAHPDGVRIRESQAEFAPNGGMILHNDLAFAPNVLRRRLYMGPDAGLEFAAAVKIDHGVLSLR